MAIETEFRKITVQLNEYAAGEVRYLLELEIERLGHTPRWIAESLNAIDDELEKLA